MKVAITGHTKGLGKELSTKFDSVVGFSSSNGYDISSPYDRADMMVRIEGCNVFINNAHSNFHQTELFMDVFEKWKYKEKTIVNIIRDTKVQGYEQWKIEVAITPENEYRVYLGLMLPLGEFNKLADMIEQEAQAKINSKLNDIETNADEAFNELSAVPVEKVEELM